MTASSNPTADNVKLIAELHSLANLEEFVDDALADLLSRAADALEAAQPVKLDRAKVAEVLCRYMDEDSGEGGVCPACKGQARALCDAAERGELSAS